MRRERDTISDYSPSKSTYSYTSRTEMHIDMKGSYDGDYPNSSLPLSSSHSRQCSVAHATSISPPYLGRMGR